MMKNRAGWASENGQTTKIRLSEGCGGKVISMAVQLGCNRNGFEDYLGNVG
jgi:hypothetical protein